MQEGRGRNAAGDRLATLVELRSEAEVTVLLHTGTCMRGTLIALDQEPGRVSAAALLVQEEAGHVYGSRVVAYFELASVEALDVHAA